MMLMNHYLYCQRAETLPLKDEYLKQLGACQKARDWAFQFLNMEKVLMNCHRPDWLHWLCVRAMTPKQYATLAVCLVRNVKTSTGKSIWDSLSENCQREISLVEKILESPNSEEMFHSNWGEVFRYIFQSIKLDIDVSSQMCLIMHSHLHRLDWDTIISTQLRKTSKPLSQEKS